METSIAELLTYYLIVSVVFIGAPGVFFFIVFMPALQNTKGRMVGYKEHVTYGDSSINTFARSDLKVGPDVPVRQLSFPLQTK